MSIELAVLAMFGSFVAGAMAVWGLGVWMGEGEE